MTEQVGQDVVLFGGTGDLVMRKLLPALYHLHRDRMLGDDVSIIGIAREPLDTAEYRQIALEQCRGYLKSDFDEAHWQAFEARIRYRQLDARDAASFGALAECLGDVGRRSQVYYLSTSPALFTSLRERSSRGSPTT